MNRKAFPVKERLFYLVGELYYQVQQANKKVEAHINPWYNCNNHKTKNQGGFI
jgi:hypothetical protein